MSRHTVTIQGVEWHEYTCEFRHDGKTYSFEIWATDDEDAERRLRSIRGNAEVLGQLGGTIEASPATSPVIGLWVRLKCWWLNLR